MSWLQGGPFLEVSLIIKKDNVRHIISKLTNLNDDVFSYKTINPTDFLERGIRKRYIGVGIRCEGKTKVTNLSSNLLSKTTEHK